MTATCFRCGQETFEGLKAYRCPDGKVHVFRVEEDAKRSQNTGRGIAMPEVPAELFAEMVKKAVRLDQEYIPPYESGAPLYIRPLLIDTSAQAGVRLAEEYCSLIFITPIGPYSRDGFCANPYIVIRDVDRAASLGTGMYRIDDNYAASPRANRRTHEQGHASEFYLDAKEKKYVDGCDAADFFGIKDNTYTISRSNSILLSITNKSLMQITEDPGMRVERCPIPEDELDNSGEAGACGTAAIIPPMSHLDDTETGEVYSLGDKPGPWSTKLYETLRGIQYGIIEDKHGWTTVVIK